MKCVSCQQKICTLLLLLHSLSYSFAPLFEDSLQDPVASRFGPPPASLHSLMASAQAASSCSGGIQKNDELIELSGFSGSILLLEAVFVGRDSATSPGRYDPAEPFPSMLSV